MWPLAVLALAAAVPEEPLIGCVVRGRTIVVRFSADFRRIYADADKFAVIRAGTLRGGEWRFVVDEGDERRPPLRLSPYRPDMKRLAIDTRGQLATRYSERTGRMRIVRAFPKPGRYILIFSDNLGTEPEEMASGDCTVRLR